MLQKNALYSVCLVLFVLITGLHRSTNSYSMSVPYDLNDCNNVFLPLLHIREMQYFKGSFELEPNNSYLEANSPIISGEVYYGQFNDQKDYYGFYLKESGSFAISLDNVLVKGVQLQLFYQDTKSGNIKSAKSPPYQIQYTGPAGWYYIYVAIDSRYVNTSNSYYYLRANYANSLTRSLNATGGLSASCTTQLPTITVFTPTHTPTTIPPIQTGFDFESGTQSWVTSEGQYKLAVLDTTTQIKYSKNQSLRVTTQLNNSKDIYRYTEAVAYFNSAIPEGINKAGPYNLAGKQVSCFVYFPSEMSFGDSSQVRAILFVKDTEFDNQYGDTRDIFTSNVAQWIKLSFVVGEGQGTGANFDATKTNALGVRVEVQSGATINYTGSYYIDRCSIEYP